MKKLMVLFLIAIVSFFLFSGCQGLIPSEGEGEEEPEGIVVDIQGSVQVEGKTYLSRGTHDITVTFPAPVTGIVKGYITYCTGDYSKKVNGDGTEVIFFPNTDRTAWTGSGSFQDSQSLCCASYLEITSGACEEEACIRIPIIIDSEPPYATIEVCLSDCTCDGCELSFTSTTTSLDCAEDTANSGDDCSGLAGWSLALYEDYPFDDCCETPCAEPVFTCSGTDCPIECTTGCLTEDLYYALVTLVDHTGNEVSFGTQIEIDPEDCSSLVLSDLEAGDCLDTPWNSGFVVCEGVIPDWTSEIRIADYQGKEAMEIGDMVYSTINSGMITIYNLTDHELRISFSKETSGGGSTGGTGPYDAYKSYSYYSVGDQILSSVEPYSDEFGSGWEIIFVYP